jgi:hypothetical protein
VPASSMQASVAKKPVDFMDISFSLLVILLNSKA